MENTIYNFEVNAVLGGDKLLKVSAPAIPKAIVTVVPPPFKDGIAGYWSAEHLFLASIASCFGHTFRIIADLSELPFESFSCTIEGEVERIDKVFAFYKVRLFPTLVIPLETYRLKAESILEKTERNCIVRNSLKTEVIIESKILVNQEIAYP